MSADIQFIDTPESLFIPCKPSKNDSLGCDFAKTMGIFSLYLLPATLLLMALVNPYTVYYYWAVKRKLGGRHVVYMGLLAIADLACIVVVGGFWFVPAKGVPYATSGIVGFFTYNMGEPICKLHRTLVLFTSALCCNVFLVAVTDRCLAIYLPFSYGRLSKSTGWYIALGTLLLTLVMVIPFIFLMGYFVSEGITFCWLTESSPAWQIYSTVFFNCGTVQSVLIIAVNVALVFKLFEVKRMRKKLMAGTTADSSKPAAGSLNSKEIRLTMLMVIMSSIYAVCSSFQIIGVVFGFYSTYVRIDRQIQRLGFNLGDIGYHLFFWQMLSNFFVYLARVPDFRAHFLSSLHVNTAVVGRVKDTYYADSTVQTALPD